MGDQDLVECLGLTQQDMAADVSDAVPAVAVDDLGIEQSGIDAPKVAAFNGSLLPGSEMGHQRKEIQCQAIT